MRAKRIKLILLILIIVLSSSGCWDSVDTEDKDVAISVLVDKTEDGYAFYVNVASLSSSQQGNGQGSEQSGTKFRLLMGEGKTFIEAREDLDRVADQPIFLGAAQAVILTERLAYSGIEEYMLRIRQTPEYRKTFDVVVTGEEPEKLLHFQPENTPSVGFSIDSTIKSLVDTGQTFHFSLGDILMTLASPNKCYLLHTIGLKTDVALTGYSVFDSGRCVGFIPIEQSKGVLFLKSADAKPYYDIAYDDGKASLRVRSTSKKVKPSYTDGKIVFDVNLNIDAQVLYISENRKVPQATREAIASALEKRIVDDLSNAIITSKEFGCDYLGFYTAFRIAYPEQIKSMDWKEEYQKAGFNISVKAKIDLVSTVNYSE